MKPLHLHATPLNAPPNFFTASVAEARRFYLPLNEGNARRLAVVCGGLEHCTPDYAIHRTAFPFYCIEYVARGHGSLKLHQRFHPLQPGHVFSYGPGVRHDIKSDPADPLVKYFVDFNGTHALKLLQAASLAPGLVVQISPPQEVQNLFDELISSGIRGTRHSADLCARLLECLLLKIDESHAPLGAKESRAFTTYQQCRQHVQRHFLRLKGLDEVAKECCVGPAYLCRLFRRYDHQSPYQYLLQLKMTAAAELLQRPDVLVKQVAEQVGFIDQFHFSRAFKRTFGVPPDAMHRRH